MKLSFKRLFLILLTGVSVAQVSSSMTAATSEASRSAKTGSPTPNILFIIMDDLGIDQLRIFGYGGGTPASTPNLEAISKVGLRFRNVWAMPECSPSRAIFFEGRYPLRTNIYSAILSDDLANSQVSPFEVTTPRVLRKAGYESAMFGKFHLAGPENNPYGYGTPHALGWNYFDGFLAGAPAPIDTTIGGQFAANTYTCGFVPNASAGGADFGACYAPNLSCTDLKKDNQHVTPGRSCLESGGIFVPQQSCQVPLTKTLDFSEANGYYVWNRVINQRDGTVIQFPLDDPGVRGYVSEATNNSAIAWINAKNKTNQPWMTTVSYAAIHTPYQQPPLSLLPSSEPDSSGLSCTGNDTKNELATRVLSNQMIEAMDTEIGNLLVRTGLATFNVDGSLNYHPETTNTTVIIIGDNGTFAPGVKAPFDPNRAKGFVYQTGVWVPLIVAGPQVVLPNRDVTAMVNAADLFQLFGEIAGLDVHQVVPRSHILDSVSMMPYLTTPGQPGLRQTNFTQTGNNIHPVTPAPCVIPLTSPPTCAQLFTGQAICADEGGIWYGPGSPTPYPSCCAIQNANLSQYPNGIQILPDLQSATRNDSYKVVQLEVPNCATSSGEDMLVTEFYQINENVPAPLIDKSGDSLCGPGGCPDGLSGDALKNYRQLLASQQATLSSQPVCPGDGDEDQLVNQRDVNQFHHFANLSQGTSSWYDFNLDGFTNGEDLSIIQQNLGKSCKPVVVTGAQFADVPPSASYFDAANLMFEAGITLGCMQSSDPSTRLFCPDTLGTRQEIAAFIVRAVTGTTNPALYNHTPSFSDVPDTNSFFPHIQKLLELGITSGCGTGLFCPTEAVPRWQMAVFMVRARLALNGANFSFNPFPYFADVPANIEGSGEPFPFIQRSYEERVTTGCGTNPLTYCPDSMVTRGEMASFLMRGLFNETLVLPANAPLLTSATPNAMASTPGSQITVTILGVNTNFHAGDTVGVPSGRLDVSNIQVNSANSITATLTTNVVTVAGPQSLVVATGGRSLTLPLAIRVGTY